MSSTSALQQQIGNFLRPLKFEKVRFCRSEFDCTNQPKLFSDFFYFSKEPQVDSSAFYCNLLFAFLSLKLFVTACDPTDLPSQKFSECEHNNQTGMDAEEPQLIFLKEALYGL